MRIAVGTADEVDVFDDAVDDVGFVDGETLIFPEVAVNYALSNWLLHDVGGVEAIGREGARGASLIEKTLLICAVVGGHFEVVVCLGMRGVEVKIFESRSLSRGCTIVAMPALFTPAYPQTWRRLQASTLKISQLKTTLRSCRKN